jgi:hypothetical protein
LKEIAGLDQRFLSTVYRPAICLYQRLTHLKWATSTSMIVTYLYTDPTDDDISLCSPFGTQWFDPAMIQAVIAELTYASHLIYARYRTEENKVIRAIHTLIKHHEVILIRF